jgi:hypothetical protein
MSDEKIRELEDIVDRLTVDGKVTGADLTMIIRAIEQLQACSQMRALSGPYWEARYKALHPTVNGSMKSESCPQDGRHGNDAFTGTCGFAASASARSRLTPNLAT